MSEANHNLNRLLDKPGDIIEKSFFTARLPDQVESGAVNPNFRTTPLSGICTQEMVLKRDADEKKKKIVFGKV